MDPVSAVGLASSIITFIEFGSKLLKGAKEIRDSANDSLKKNESREVIAEAMKEAVAKLKTPDPVRIPLEQQKLCDLAVKCSDLSNRILELLQKIKPKNKMRLRVYRASYRAWRKEDEIRVLEESLRDCRSQLALSLTHLASKNSAESSNRILAMVQKDSSKLEQLQAHMKELRRGVEAQVIGDEALEQLRLVLEIHDEALDAIYQDRILRSLQFEGMHRRDSGVRDPYENTFKWVMEDEDEAMSDDTSSLSSESLYGTRRGKMKRLSRTMFLNWLSSGAGIFHISGKLASGKSTLMKFLSTHPRTQTEIKKWAGDRTLVLASFFFWKPGSELQKSLEGLFRSLLCDVLTACPELIRDTLPEYWRRAEQSPWQIQTRFNIPASTVNSALKSVISNGHLYQGHRFCFFIDGLDEYEGTDGQDPTYLATLLNSWAKDSHGCLKLCVSSREHNVFMNSFSMDQRLRLHELTLFDMQEYVAGYLQDMQSDTLSEGLRNNLTTWIPERANGIFLWTILVVRAIRRKVEDGEPEKNLIKLLDSLPRGLSSVLHRILEDLDADNRRRTYQTMAMLRVTKANKLPFSLLAFSFLDDYEKDAEFSTRGNIPTDKTREGAQRRLRGACGGLVEAKDSEFKKSQWTTPWISSWESPWGSPWGNPWGSLEYTHRSVPEMFDEGALKREMESILERFDAINAISHLTFAAAQFLGGPGILEPRTICAGLARMRLESDVEEAPYPFLDHIASWLECDSLQLKPGDEVRLIVDTSSSLMLGVATAEESLVQPSGECFYGNVLCLAAYLGCPGYVKWKMEQSPKAMNSSLERAFLAHIVLHKSPTDLWSWDFFFDSKIFTDPTAIGYAASDPSHRLSRAGNLTTWQRFLAFEFLKYVLPDDTSRMNKERSGLIIQKFLEHGASGDFYFSSIIGSDPLSDRCNITLAFGSRDTSPRPHYLKKLERLSRSRPMPGESQPNGMDTLRDWVARSKYPNRDRILELLCDDRKKAAVVSMTNQEKNAKHSSPPGQGKGSLLYYKPNSSTFNVIEWGR